MVLRQRHLPPTPADLLRLETSTGDKRCSTGCRSSKAPILASGLLLVLGVRTVSLSREPRSLSAPKAQPASLWSLGCTGTGPLQGLPTHPQGFLYCIWCASDIRPLPAWGSHARRLTTRYHILLSGHPTRFPLGDPRGSSISIPYESYQLHQFSCSLSRPGRFMGFRQREEYSRSCWDV